jgi:hypothetical protein
MVATEMLQIVRVAEFIKQYLEEVKEGGEEKWFYRPNGAAIEVFKILPEKGRNEVACSCPLGKREDLIQKLNIKDYSWEFQCFEDSDTKYYSSYDASYGIVSFRNFVVYSFSFWWLKEKDIPKIVEGRIEKANLLLDTCFLFLHRKEIEDVMKEL